MSYTTVQGQTWDQIAKEVYGKEKYADVLMEANPKLLDTFIFSAGVVVNTPKIAVEEKELPPWRK